MPFYEYECSNCQHYVEALQKISDEPLKQCPSCKKQTLKKLVSAPNFRLKGSGWYETDFKSDQEAKRNLADRDEPTESKSEAKGSDAKTADTQKAAAKKSVAVKAPAKSVAKESKGKSASKKAPAKKAAKPAAKKQKKTAQR